MKVEGEFDTEGVVQGADFLPEKAGDRAPLTGTVVVVGGGNTAMDVARTSWRLGADKVIILYRRTKDEMPADKMEIEDCLDEGIEIMELAAPVGIVTEDGKLKALALHPDEARRAGRIRPAAARSRSRAPSSTSPAIWPSPRSGRRPLLDGLDGARRRARSASTKWNTFVVDPDDAARRTSTGVFAGGDAADDGPTVVIDAIGDGQRAARAIDA